MGSVLAPGRLCQSKIELWDPQLVSEDQRSGVGKTSLLEENTTQGQKEIRGSGKRLCKGPGVGRSSMGFGQAFDAWFLWLQPPEKGHPG